MRNWAFKNKLMIKGYEPVKTTNVMNILGLGPINHVNVGGPGDL